MIVHTLAQIAADPNLVPSDPQTIGPGAWLNLAGTVVTVLGALFCAVRYVVRKFTALTRTSDGQPLALMVEKNSTVLTDLAARIETVADDVRDVRTHHTGLTERVGRIESYLFPSSNGTGRKGWFS